MSKNDQPKRDKRRRERREEHERLQRELGRVNDLLEEQAFDEAEKSLDALARRFPNRLEVMELQANLAQEQKRWPAAVEAYERWSRLAPDDADVAFALGFAYGASASIVSAAKIWRDAVARWPEDRRAPNTRELLDAMAGDIATGLALFPGEGAAREDLACRHERILLLMSRGAVDAARGLAAALVAEHPSLASVRNNLAQCLWLEGHTEEALAVVEGTLREQPDNVHALANSARLLLLLGQEAEARERAERLKRSARPAADREEKIAETLLLLGDDAGVLEVAASADLANHPQLRAQLGQAHLNLGHEDQGRQIFVELAREATDQPELEEILEDLEQDPSRRLGAWGLPLGTWLPASRWKAFAERIDAARANAREEIVRSFPDLLRVAPLVLARGDQHAYRLVRNLCVASRAPTLVETLRSFALGKAAPDGRRVDAAMSLSKADLLPSGEYEMWKNGQPHPVRFEVKQIHREPLGHYPPRVEALVMQAMRVDPRSAEDLLRRALALIPGDPGLEHNLIGAIGAQPGRYAEAVAMTEALHARVPDYFFARAALARIRVGAGRLEDAKELLRPLRARSKLHVAEFGVLSAAEVDLLLASGEPSTAAQILDQWERVDPENPQLAALRRQMRTRS